MAVEPPNAGPAPVWWRRSLLAVTGAAFLIGCALLGRDAFDFAGWVQLAVGLGVIGGGLVWWCAHAWRRARPGWTWLALVLGLAIACRVGLMPADRMLSDDACRYHWDGKVLASGVNPYRFAPDDPALAHLKGDPSDGRINHPDRVTVYPPGAQVFFALGYWLSPGSLAGFKLLSLLAEVVCWLLLLWELQRRGLPRAWLLVAAWSPLLICQGNLSGHVDLLGLPWLALLVISAARGWPLRAGLALAVACLIKPLGVIFVPALVVELGWRRSLIALGAAAGLAAVAYLPFFGAGWNLFSSTWLMFTRWEFNGSLAVGLEALLPIWWAHSMAAGLLAALLGLAVWRRRDLVARMLLAMAALVVCSPTLFPWYLAWMFPLLVLRPDPSLLALGVLIPLTDFTVVGFQSSGTWALPMWVRLAEYLPFYGLLAISAAKGWGMFQKCSDSQAETT